MADCSTSTEPKPTHMPYRPQLMFSEFLTALKTIQDNQNSTEYFRKLEKKVRTGSKTAE